MAVYRIADLYIDITVHSAFARRVLEAYRVPDAACDLTIVITPDDVKAEEQISNVTSYGRCEATAVLRKLCDRLLYDFDGMFLHAATIVYRGKAYAFVAPSGTGKSTHIRLWQEVLGDEVRVLNGDKLLIRRQNGRFIAYGSPWQGKENWGENAACELGGIYLLHRAAENRAETVSTFEALRGMLAGTVIPKDPGGKHRVIDFLEALLAQVDVWALHCNRERDAVFAACSRITV